MLSRDSTTYLRAIVPAAWLPVIGGILGLAGCLLMVSLPRGPGAVAALALWTAATLASGERGLSRWIPRFPLLASLLAGCTILVRWYALISLQTPAGLSWTGIVAAMVLGPAALVALAWVSRPVESAAFLRLSVMTTPMAMIAMAEGVVAQFARGPRTGSVLVLSAYILFRAVSAFTTWRFGGVRESDLQAFRILVETTALALMASLPDL